MMRSKIYFLFILFLLIILQSIFVDSYDLKSSSALDYKTKEKNNDDDGGDDDKIDDGKDDYKKKYNDYDDKYSQQSTYDRDRYSPYGSSSKDYRSRSRWPSSYENSYDSDDWSSNRYGLNNILSGLSGILPPGALDNGRFMSSGRNCYPLLDPQYPLFSDICGAIPQARYALPNAFGHVERWQIIQTLTTILSSLPPNPGCTRSLRLLLCPLLFPSCPTRYEASPILPCQPFCRAVKAQCAAPSLELLPCDFLPYTSDLCPINPTPYSSLLASFMQPSPLNGGLVPSNPLASLLAQSALSSALSQSEIPPSQLASLLSSPIYSSAMAAANMPPPPPTISTFTPPTGAQLPMQTLIHAQSPTGVNSPGVSPYSGQIGTPSPTLTPQSGASPALPSFLPQPHTPSPTLVPPNMSPPGLSRFFSPPAMPSLPLNQLYNVESMLADTLNPILVDFPPSGFAQHYRQASRYFPKTRSSTEKV